MLVAILALATPDMVAPSLADAESALQSSLVAYAANNVGKQVGSGQCAELVSKALDRIEAKPYGTYADAPSMGDYVWGRRVATITPGASNLRLEPGDILQFRNVKIVTKSGYATVTYTASQHTAIVESIDAATGEAKILQQNSRGRSYVTRDSLSLKDIKSGTIWAYRAQPR